MAEKTITKTPYLANARTLASNPFNRVRWNVNEIEGKWDAAVRALDAIRQCKDLNDARRMAADAAPIHRLRLR